MAKGHDRMRAALEEVAARVRPEQVFALERYQASGTPPLWEEAIAIRHGHQQTFCRLRSPADEGGVPIGRWHGPAEGALVQLLARTLLEVGLLELVSEEVPPGAPLLRWRYLTEAGLGELVAPAAAPTLEVLEPLELELRRLANDLEDTHRGAELRCELELTSTAGGASARVRLVSSGSEDILLANPLARNAGPRQFLRVEMGPPPEATPGVTEAGIQYQALPLPVLPSPLPPPWDQRLLLLRAGASLELPVPVPLLAARPGRSLVRAVYAGYGFEPDVAGVPVIRGQAFSEELEVELGRGAHG